MAVTEVLRPSRTAREMAFVVAAVPVGPLAHAIDAYRQAVSVRVGKNSAHETPPHCVLALCDSDHPTSVGVYRRALAATLETDRGALVQPGAIVMALTTNGTWHGLEIDSDLLRTLAAEFVVRSSVSSRRVQARSGGPMRLALATDFDAADHEVLSDLAHRIIDPRLHSDWEVGLWQCHDNAWECLSRSVRA